MFLPMVLNGMNPLLKETFIDDLLKSNERTKESGLVLTREEVRSILEAREHVLRSLGRVELGIEVTKALIESFGTSSFINDENYVPVLYELHEIFYYLKNETEDAIADDKLISILKDYFENSCGGSIDLLKSNLEEFAEEFRRKAGIKDFFEEGDE